MPRYIIERDIPAIGSSDREQLRGAAAQSNAVLNAMQAEGKAIQWEHTYVVQDKTFCVYLADHEASVHEHARLSGFPASRVTEVRTVISPMTAA